MPASIRCVVVDDDPDFLAFTTCVLRRLCRGAELMGFDSAIDALDFLRRNSVDLIVTDFRMPLIDGIRLITAVRAVDRDVPIVMMSGEDAECAATNAGANAFVLKSALLRGLRQVLERLAVPGNELAAGNRETVVRV